MVRSSETRRVGERGSRLDFRRSMDGASALTARRRCASAPVWRAGIPRCRARRHHRFGRSAPRRPLARSCPRSSRMVCFEGISARLLLLFCRAPMQCRLTRTPHPRPLSPDTSLRFDSSAAAGVQENARIWEVERMGRGRREDVEDLQHQYWESRVVRDVEGSSRARVPDLPFGAERVGFGGSAVVSP